jgi:hypothetical protein
MTNQSHYLFIITFCNNLKHFDPISSYDMNQEYNESKYNSYRKNIVKLTNYTRVLIIETPF